MSDNQDVFRKVGRGGAGNFIPKKLSQTRPVEEDAEKQTYSADDVVTTGTVAPASEHVRSGRGGAGNFVDRQDMPGPKETNELNSDVTAAVVSKLKKHPHPGGLGGRGGAGNYEARQEQEDQRQEQDTTSKLKNIEDKVKETVESALKMPEKAHHGHKESNRYDINE